MMYFTLTLLLLMPSVVHAQVRDGIAVCCGRQESFRNYLPPIDSRRFTQQFGGRTRGFSRPRAHEVLPESSYPIPFSLYNGEYEAPDVSGVWSGRLPSEIPKIREWHPTDEGWPTNNLERYFNSNRR